MKTLKYGCIALLAGAFLMSSPGDVSAQNDDEILTRHVIFDGLLVDGDALRPDGMFATARDRARFDSLLSLRRSFVSEISEAAKSNALQ